MDDDKLSFNPLNTHAHYDLSKYAKEAEGNEILIDHNVQPIIEQDDEESKFDHSSTPISSQPRGGYPASSSTATTPNYQYDKSAKYGSNRSGLDQHEKSMGKLC